MSKVSHPEEKKRLSYERDHYNRGGQHDKAWRKIKPRKKTDARRAFRKALNNLVPAQVSEENEGKAVLRRIGSQQQEKVLDYGARPLGELVPSVIEGRKARVGAKKKRQAKRLGRDPL